MEAETIAHRKKLAKLAMLLRTSECNKLWPHCESSEVLQIDGVLLTNQEERGAIGK